LSSICIPSSVDIVCERCFSRCTNLANVTFETGAKLSCIEGAFQNCSFLPSICIPSSVESINENCFCGCYKLSTITFEAGSKLTRIAFKNCSTKLSIVFLQAKMSSVEDVRV
jgi:hypothetical protein